MLKTFKSVLLLALIISGASAKANCPDGTPEHPYDPNHPYWGPCLGHERPEPMKNPPRAKGMWDPPSAGLDSPVTDPSSSNQKIIISPSSATDSGAD